MNTRILNDIYNLIADKKYNNAKNKLDELDIDLFKDYGFEIKYLRGLIEEKEHFEDIKGTKKDEQIKMFLRGGKDASYYNNDDEAIDYYLAGAYVTEEPIFYFLAGRVLLSKLDRREEGAQYLKEYLRLGGKSKAYKAYEYLGRYYCYVDKNKSKKYYKRYNRLCSIITITNSKENKKLNLEYDYRG